MLTILIIGILAIICSIMSTIIGISGTPDNLRGFCNGLTAGVGIVVGAVSLILYLTL